MDPLSAPRAGRRTKAAPKEASPSTRADFVHQWQCQCQCQFQGQWKWKTRPCSSTTTSRRAARRDAAERRLASWHCGVFGGCRIQCTILIPRASFQRVVRSVSGRAARRMPGGGGEPPKWQVSALMALQVKNQEIPAMKYISRLFNSLNCCSLVVGRILVRIYDRTSELATELKSDLSVPGGAFLQWDAIKFSIGRPRVVISCMLFSVGFSVLTIFSDEFRSMTHMLCVVNVNKSNN